MYRQPYEHSRSSMVDPMPQFSTFHITDPSKSQTFRGRPSKGCNKCRSRKVKVGLSCRPNSVLLLNSSSATKDTRSAKDARKVELLASIAMNSSCSFVIRRTKRRRPPRRNGEVGPRSHQQKSSQKERARSVLVLTWIEKRAWNSSRHLSLKLCR